MLKLNYVFEQFVELLRVENGEIKKKIQYPVYSDIGDTMARRTFDESCKLCKDWVIKYTKLPNFRRKGEEGKLGTWIKDQKARKKYDNLSADQIKMIEEIPGWVW